MDFPLISIDAEAGLMATPDLSQHEIGNVGASLQASAGTSAAKWLPCHSDGPAPAEEITTVLTVKRYN
jgi:hypothetical protein